MKNIIKNKWFRLSVILVVIVCLVFVFSGANKTKATYRTATAFKGDLEVSISGSGSVSSSESRKEYSKVNSTVENVFFEEGDEVKAGDIIASLDNNDYDVTVESQRVALKQAQLSKNTIDKQVSNLLVRADASGYIEDLKISENDFITTNSTVCNIVSNDKYEIILQFVYNMNNTISVGNTAKVLLDNSMIYLDGVVTNVSDKSYIAASGSKVIDVTIEVENNSMILSGFSANAEVYSNVTVSSNNHSKFNTANQVASRTQSTGTVEAVYVKDGKFVNNGDIIAKLKNDDLLVSQKTSELSLKNLTNQLNYMEDKLDDYKIISPIDGRITAQDIKVGDLISAGKLLSTISDSKLFEIEVPVDELDITKINYDSVVEITVDAIDDTVNNPISGRIKKLPLEGVTQGGVTDYYVTIEFDGRDDIRISMNANADIIVAKRENVVQVPMEAVVMKNKEPYVEVVVGEKTEMKKVTTGISSSSYIEVIDGVNEGELVVVPELGSGMGLFSF